MKSRAAGFSLIELMVAMALGVVLLGGVLGIFLSSRATYETTDRLSRLQDSGRFALDSIVRDLRSAGYLGCSRRAQLTNTLNQTDNLQWDFALPVKGLDADAGSWSPALQERVGINPATGTDVLVVRMPRGEFEPIRVVPAWYMVARTDPIESLDNATPSLIDAGDIVQISDCNSRSVFQVTGNAAGVISHLAAAPPSEEDSEEEPDDSGEHENNLPGNETNDLGYAYGDTAELVVLESVIYYVAPAPAPATGNSLYRRVSGGGSPEELARGVENMQLQFGERDGNALVYRRGGQVENWQNVHTVRLALLVRSTSEYGSAKDTAKYELLDTTIEAPGDRHLRQVFSTTVGIRNNPT